MKTVRLSAELEDRLQRAARITGESLSEFIRKAAAERATATLNAVPTNDFDDVLGAIHGGGGRARRTGESFDQVLREGARRG